MAAQSEERAYVVVLGSLVAMKPTRPCLVGDTVMHTVLNSHAPSDEETTISTLASSVTTDPIKPRESKLFSIPRDCQEQQLTVIVGGAVHLTH